MKHLIIIGARGWGREVYAAAIGTKAYRDGEYDIKGFLDSKTDALDGLKGDYPPIICAPETYTIQEDDVFFVAMGDPYWRKHYAKMMENKGAKFMSFIAVWSCISANVTLGKHTMVHSFSTVGHDVKIGNYSSVEAYSFLGGYAEIGEESVMHVRSTLIAHKKIGNNVSVGANSVVMRNVRDGLHVFGNPATKIDY